MIIFKNIIIEAFWFKEGNFWNIQIHGYHSDDDDGVCLNGTTSLDSLKPEYSTEEVLEQLEMLSVLYKNQADKVTILVNDE